ncbi:MAG: hypothetical protein A2Y57_03425 [Candidatus Woykebacteria bacterium RBG_13_40_7b]|uniref:OBG-type G domain-containing protein n=1 Tax=Candidatus Woykebacteria bacterium RBG_13_40_7b TaxID=1802594 RepID=A0A1G1W9S3_9BACT|nr:MAG: hypothetical protein A2Y57_03425 [Candidatus Woykebacteria bacterium RBG_13_40_7b]
MLKVGLVGLPNAGKSTLFNALLQRQIAHIAEYPFTTIEPNVGIVEVPDERLEKISQATQIKKIVPAAIEFIDIAGLVKGAHEGEGLGNHFLAHIREVDSILHLVRDFDAKIPHFYNRVNPKDDLEIVDLELKLGGIEKPTLYLFNLSETKLKEAKDELYEKIVPKKAPFIVLCAKLEAEIHDLPAEEAQSYLKELGIGHLALDQVIKKSYELLDLISFFTVAKGTQVQAWPLRRGSNIFEAAGGVHTDFQEKFIVAEVISYGKLVKAGNWHKAKEEGLVEAHGKDYEVRDSDVVEFKIHS